MGFTASVQGVVTCVRFFAVSGLMLTHLQILISVCYSLASNKPFHGAAVFVTANTGSIIHSQILRLSCNTSASSVMPGLMVCACP